MPWIGFEKWAILQTSGNDLVLSVCLSGRYLHALFKRVWESSRKDSSKLRGSKYSDHKWLI